MLRLHGVIGHETEARLRARLHALAHRHGVEYLFVPAEEADRKRFRISTDQGTDCAVSLDRTETLSDGALLYLDEQKAVVVRFGRQRVWRLRAAETTAALKLGWNAGNLHWRVRFEGQTLAVLLDRPIEEYRARIASLIESGEIVEVTDDA
jgi:urease accessory protein